MPALILFGILSALWRNTPRAETRLEPRVVSLETSLLTEKDSDGDGVKDWEEVIWKTDPANPNTFDMPDSEYIALQLEKASAGGNSSGTSGPIESSEELSEQLFAEYVALKQSDQVNPVTIQQMTERLASSIKSDSQTTPYQESALSLFPDTDNAKLQSYANALMSIVTQHSQTYAAAQASFEGQPGTQGFSDNMVFASNTYFKLAAEIMRLEVPMGLAGAHTAYANSLQLSGSGLQKLSAMQTEPLQAVVGIQQHTAAQSAQSASISNIQSFMERNGILGFSLPLL